MQNYYAILPETERFSLTGTAVRLEQPVSDDFVTLAIQIRISNEDELRDLAISLEGEDS